VKALIWPPPIPADEVIHRSRALVGENQLTALADHAQLTVRMFHSKGTTTMTTRTYAAEAMSMAGVARVRVFQPCSASPAIAVWSPISLGTTNDKHGRPRRPEVSHP
jgi:hypothetical protein